MTTPAIQCSEHNRIRVAKPPSIVRTLALLFLLFVVSTFLFEYRQVQNALQEAARTDAIVLRMTSKLIEEHEENILATLKAYTSRPLFVDSLKRGDIEGIHYHIADLKNNSDEIDVAFVTDEKGLSLANYPEFPEAIGKDLSIRDWYKRVSASLHPYLSTVLQVLVSRRPLAVVAAVPVIDSHGRMVGILANSNRLATIADLLGPLHANLPETVYVLDQEGNVVYNSKYPPPEKIISYPLFGEVLNLLERKLTNTEVIDENDGKRKKFLAVDKNDLGWTIVVERTLSATLRQEYGRIARTAAIAGLSFLMVAGFFLYQHVLQKKALALQQSREKYRSLVENMLDGFAYCRIIYDEQGRAVDLLYLEVNNSFARLTGLEDVVGKKYSEIFPAASEAIGALLDRYARVAATGESDKLEFYFKPLALWLDLSVSSHERGHILVLFSDITERKKAEELLRTLNDQLERRVEQRTHELQETQAHYLHAEKLAAIGKLSASIAHEFNNPLMAVMTVLKGLLRTAKLEEVERNLLLAATEESERMKKLIGSLRDFNRPSSGQKMLMDVHASLDSILLLHRSDFNKKRITTVLRYADRLPQIMAIPDQIKQVFLNLLTNAADACLETGRVITISTGQDGQRVSVAIEDTGIGIAPDKIDLIFQPFFTTKPEVKGTGLGLSVSHGIVRSHHGEIRVESLPGEGSTFTVLLPIDGA